MPNGCRAQPCDVGGMRELLHRLGSSEVVRLSDPAIDQLLPTVDHLTESIPDAAEPVAELRAWSRLLVALTDRLADGPLEPASPRDRVLRIMIGKAARMASAALHQIVSLRGGHPVSDPLDGDLRGNSPTHGLPADISAIRWSRPST